MNLSQDDLAQFSGSEEFYKHLNGLIYTQGIQFLAEKSGAHWLIDAIASYQADKRIRRNAGLLGFQLWELTVYEDKSALLTLRRDTGELPTISQTMEYTDFPLKEIPLYVCNGTLLLPSEY